MNDQVKNEEIDSEIIQLSVSDQMLTDFQVKYHANNLPDVATKDGYAFVKNGLADLRGHRTGTETFRKQAVAPLNARAKYINGICNDLMDELKTIEAPMKELKAEQDLIIKEAKEAKERENTLRIATITATLAKIGQRPADMIDSTPEEIEAELAELMALDLDNDFDEFVIMASDIVPKTIERLESLRQTRIDSIEMQKIIAQQEAQELAEKAEKDKADAIQRAKDQAELEELRKEKAKRESQEAEVIANAKRIALENEPVPEVIETTPEVFIPVIKDPTPQDMAQIMSLEARQEDIIDVKEQSIEALEVFIAGETVNGRAINPSGLAKIIFDAIYIGGIPNIKFDLPE